MCEVYRKGSFLRLILDKQRDERLQHITMKNDRPVTLGTCHTCYTKMFKIGKGFNISPLPYQEYLLNLALHR